MDAMKEALKRKIEMLKEHHDGDAVNLKEEKLLDGDEPSDVAPEAEQTEEDEKLMEIIQALADQGRGKHDESSLGGRVAMQAREKMQSMKK